jgi:HEAT repeat protein
MKYALVLQLLAAISDPAGLRNAKLTSRAVGPGGLAAEVRTAAAAPGPSWIGYSEPVIDGPRQMCCFDSGVFRGHAKAGCFGCRLEKEETAFSLGRDPELVVSLESPPRFRVLLRVGKSGVEKVRALSEDCALDAGGLPFLWLTAVGARESVDFLATLVPGPGGHGDEDHLGPILAAIAVHADPAADAVLEKLVARGQPRELRKQAAFWLGSERGRKGFEIIRSLLSDPDPGFRQHLMFCLSESSVREAQSTLIRLARHDPEGEVRGQALFWLAQKAGDRAAATIQEAIRDDPEEEVKKKAVFALSQLRGDQAVTELIRVARTNRNPEVRKQAIFWLGESGDPRALDFIETILAN